MLTARELLNTRFDQVFRGYNPSQVDSFIARLVGEYETLLQENKALKKTGAAPEQTAVPDLAPVNQQLVQAQAQLADIEQKVKAAQLELQLLQDERIQLQQKLRVLLQELGDLVARQEEAPQAVPAGANGNGGLAPQHN